MSDNGYVALSEKVTATFYDDEHEEWMQKTMTIADVLDSVCDDYTALPSAQPGIKPIDYRDCANAMLKMWMLDVVTDGEYYRIMDKLNAFERKRREKEGD